MSKNVSFATLRPALMEEWNFEKNEGIDPQKYSATSRRKVWWRCCYGHEWQASIASRVKGCGCPYGAGKMVAISRNQIFDTPSDLIEQ